MDECTDGGFALFTSLNWMFTQTSRVSLNKSSSCRHAAAPHPGLFWRPFFSLLSLLFQPAERDARKQSTTVSAKRIHRDFISIRRTA